MVFRSTKSWHLLHSSTSLLMKVLTTIDEDLKVFWVSRFGFFFGLRVNGKKFWRFETVKGQVNLGWVFKGI